MIGLRCPECRIHMQQLRFWRYVVVCYSCKRRIRRGPGARVATEIGALAALAGVTSLRADHLFAATVGVVAVCAVWFIPPLFGLEIAPQRRRAPKPGRE